MARLSGIGPITAAIVQRLRADSGVTALVPAARIVGVATPGLDRPCVIVSVVTELDDDTLGLGGVESVVQLLIVSDYVGDAEIGAIASAVRTALDGQSVTIDGFTAPADVSYEQALGSYVEDVGGVPVRHRPVWCTVRAH